MDVDIRVLRFNPEKDESPHFEEYTVTAEPMDRLLDCLHTIKWTLDSSLALRRSCGHGVCGSDAIIVNGTNMLACKVLVKDLKQPITVEPIRGLPQLRDLIVDMEPFFAGYRAVMPWLIPHDNVETESEQLQSPAERERYEDTTKCILCAACTTACPIFWSDEEYVGPAAIVNAHRFMFDSRDAGAQQRLEILSSKHGAFRCRTIFNCTEACPRGIKVTKAIQEVKLAALLASPRMEEIHANRTLG